MSEEAVAFAGRNQLDDPFPIVPDDEPVAMVPPERADVVPEADDTQPAPHADLNDTIPMEDDGDPDTRIADPIADVVLAENSRLFLQALIGIAAGDLRRGADDMAGLGLALAGLGQALAEGEDEEQTFQDLVDAFERRRLEEAGLHSVAPLVAIFVARLASAPYRHDTTPAVVENLMRSAEEVVGAALQAAGTRAWRRLPGIVTTIAERAVHRGLSIADLIEALPRLATRFGLGPRGPVMRVVSNPDHPRRDLSRGEAAEKPRRMLISGPVEIVILDR
jgi:hypothetical protein